MGRVSPYRNSYNNTFLIEARSTFRAGWPLADAAEFALGHAVDARDSCIGGDCLGALDGPYESHSQACQERGSEGEAAVLVLRRLAG